MMNPLRCGALASLAGILAKPRIRRELAPIG